jgi:hypothetical protein
MRIILIPIIPDQWISVWSVRNCGEIHRTASPVILLLIDKKSKNMAEQISTIAASAGLSPVRQAEGIRPSSRVLKKDKTDKKDYYPEYPRVDIRGHSCKNRH